MPTNTITHHLRQAVRILAQDPTEAKTARLQLVPGKHHVQVISGHNGVAYEVTITEKQLSEKEQLLAKLEGSNLSMETRRTLEAIVGHVNPEVVREAADHRPLYDRDE